MARKVRDAALDSREARRKLKVRGKPYYRALDRNVHISDCHISVGDDCITIKSGIETEAPEKRGPCENITITNCTMAHGHGGVVLGSEMSGGIRNVTISNCIFVGTENGLRIKTRRGRGGVIEDVRASNIVMRDVLMPFTANLYYSDKRQGDPVVADAPRGPNHFLAQFSSGKNDRPAVHRLSRRTRRA